MSFEFKEEHLAAMIPTNKNVSSWYKAMMDIFPNLQHIYYHFSFVVRLVHKMVH